MRRITLLTICVVLLCLGAAQAQKCITENPDQAVEQLLFFHLVQQADLDSASLVDILDGYKMYHATMDAMLANRVKLTSEIKEAVAANKGGYELKGKLDSLMSLDQKVLAANQEAVREAASLVSPMVQAQLYLLVSNRDSVIAEARAALVGTPVCAKAAAEAAPAAVKEQAPEEIALAGVKTFVEKLSAKDVKTAMAMVSDKFENVEYGDKAGLQMFLEGAADAGYLDDIEVDMKDAKVKVNGDSATVYPIDINGSFGSATLEVVCGKADGTWKLTGLEISGI